MFFKQKTVYFNRKTLFIADKQYFSIYYTSGLPNRKTLFIADKHLKNTVYRKKLSLSSEKQSFWKI